MGTTPNRGFPYPEGTDYVASGDDAIQALAEAVDAAVGGPRMWCAGIDGGATVAPDADWAVDYANMYVGPGFVGVPDGGAVPRFAYTGPTRWFLVSLGVSVVPGAGVTSSRLFLKANGGITASAIAGAGDTHLSISVPLELTSGTELVGFVHLADGGGSYGNSWLRAVSL